MVRGLAHASFSTRRASQSSLSRQPCRTVCAVNAASMIDQQDQHSLDPLLSFGIEDSVAHAANLRRGIYVGKLQPAWRPFCRFLAVSG